MKKIKYTPEEKKIVDYIEKQNPGSIPNVSQEIGLIKNIIKDNIQKKRQINIRLLESDLIKLKSRALSEGIPYQTLLNSIVHKYLNNRIILKDLKTNAKQKEVSNNVI